MEVRVYSLWKGGALMFVGTVSQISNRYNVEPRIIYHCIRDGKDLFGMTFKTANGETLPKENKDNRYEAKKYKDSHSARFTPL